MGTSAIGFRERRRQPEHGHQRRRWYAPRRRGWRGDRRGGGEPRSRRGGRRWLWTVRRGGLWFGQRAGSLRYRSEPLRLGLRAVHVRARQPGPGEWREGPLFFAACEHGAPRRPAIAAGHPPAA